MSSIENNSEEAVPFEWLTNFSSLVHLLDPNYLWNNPQLSTKPKNRRVLHIGCGSSILAEHLVRHFHEYSFLVNADNDEETLLGMKLRWHNLKRKWKSNGDTKITSECFWTKVDFNHDEILDYDNDDDDDTNRTARYDYDTNNDTNLTDEKCLDNHFKLKKNYFDLVLDKSTLDCALCSDDAASGLLFNTYQSLTSNGIYFVVSFHHVDFILPLLKNCPGIEWDVEHHVVPRQVDTPRYIDDINATFHIPKESLLLQSIKSKGESKKAHPQSSWSNTHGTFQPDEQYGKFVNVFICRRVCKNLQHDDHSKSAIKHQQLLNRDQMTIHIHDCNDMHFKVHNPMVTHVRIEQIKQSFLDKIKLCVHEQDESQCCSDEQLLKTNILSLKSCYDILFTDAEKEHLDMDFFMEDFMAFAQEHPSLCDENGMSFEAAILFLETMQ